MASKSKKEAKKKKAPLEFRVSPKGAVSVYGLQKFPVTLYKDQWTRLLRVKNKRELLAFIEENSEQLK